MMKIIDCLIIGHNETNFEEYVGELSLMGPKSGAFRDLNLNFLSYNDVPYNVCGIYNLITNESPIKLSSTFSATIAYLGTYFSRRGLTFDYVNSFQEFKKELVEKLTNGNIKTVAITTTLYVSVFPIMEIVNFIKKYNSTVKIIIGGPFVTTQYRVSDKSTLEYLFRSIGADFYINSSQGEEALSNLVRAIKENLPVEGINNIYYKTGYDYIETPILVENNSLSENMVDWTLFSDNVGSYANIRTAISCPFSCAFCGFPQHAGKYQTASVEDIEKELNRLDAIGTVKSIFFVDDTLNIPKERFKEFLKMMIRNKYKFRWYSHYRCQFADEETVTLMKESGCEGVFLGLESGSDTILKNMNKSATVEQYVAGIKLLKKYKIITQASFIVGFPGETIETVKETISLIKHSGIDFYRAQLWYCDKITPIYGQREKYNITGSQFEWTHSTMDSKTANDLIDQMTLNINSPIRLPNFFDLDGVIRLKHKLNDDIDRVKAFLIIFNGGIQDKLRGINTLNISEEYINQFKECINLSPEYDDYKLEADTMNYENFEERIDFDFDLI